ncbi:CDKN3 [Cervus elaphus hippelaphus]|uniref:protein-tyrosine-phosphatase n=1 Tax=Cervus elaphus hippelaphus TaxID=46360 RepID=A0A212CUD7_CEREH|nr:CDKN3 [Cervus elaphus hippelaphus]
MKPPSSMQTSEFDSSDEEPIEDEQTPIQISWLPLSRVNCSQFLGLCALPGCKFKDVRRNIQKDTAVMEDLGDLVLQAIDSLRDLRGSGAIQTIKQYNYLHEFRDKLAAHLSSRDSLSRSVSR